MRFSGYKLSNLLFKCGKYFVNNNLQKGRTTRGCGGTNLGREETPTPQLTFTAFRSLVVYVRTVAIRAVCRRCGRATLSDQVEEWRVVGR